MRNHVEEGQSLPYRIVGVKHGVPVKRYPVGYSIAPLRYWDQARPEFYEDCWGLELREFIKRNRQA